MPPLSAALRAHVTHFTCAPTWPPPPPPTELRGHHHTATSPLSAHLRGHHHHLYLRTYMVKTCSTCGPTWVITPPLADLRGCDIPLTRRIYVARRPLPPVGPVWLRDLPCFSSTYAPTPQVVPPLSPDLQHKQLMLLPFTPRVGRGGGGQGASRTDCHPLPPPPGASVEEALVSLLLYGWGRFMAQDQLHHR